MRLSSLALCTLLSLLETSQAQGQTYKRKTTYDFERQQINEAPPAPKKHTDKSYQEAWRLFSQGKTAEALLKLSLVVKDPAANQALRKDAAQDLILFYAWSRSPKESRRFFEETLAASEVNEALYSLGLAYQEIGSNQEAIEVYQGLLLVDPKSDQRYLYQYNLCLSLLSSDLFNGADNVPALQAMAQLYLKSAAPSPSGQQKVSALLREAAAEWHAAGQRTKNQAYYLYAETTYELYLNTFPKEEQSYITTWSAAELQYELGEMTAEKRHWSAASALYQRVVEMNPTGTYSGIAAYVAVLAFKESGVQDPTKQLQINQLYVTYASKRDYDSQVLLSTGMAYQDLKQPNEAIKSFRALIEKAPKSSEAIFAAKYICELSQQKPDELLLYLTKIEKEVDFDEDLRKVKAQLMRKSCEEKSGLESAACFIGVAEIVTDNREKAEALYNAGISYQNAHKPALALAAFQQVSALPSPQINAYALRQSNVIQVELLDFSEAAKGLERFAKDFPGEPGAAPALQRAALYRKAMGETEAAVEDLKKYLLVASRQKLEKQEIAEAFFQIAQLRQQEAEEKPTKPNQKKAADAYELYLKDYGNTGGTPLLLQAKARLAAHLRGDSKAKDADTHCQEAVQITDAFIQSAPDKSKVIEALNLGLDAAAECQFYLAERAYEKFALGLPTITNVEDTQRIREEITLQYLKIKDYGSKGWTLAALYRIGMTSYLLAEQLQKSPLFTSLAAPITNDAKKAFSICVEGALQTSWHNEWSTRCEEQLSVMSPAEFPPLTEWTPEPTYEVQVIIPVSPIAKP